MKSDDIIAKGKERMAWVDEDGVTFKSPLNGDAHRFSAEISMGIQHKIGADIMFAFDELTTLMNTPLLPGGLGGAHLPLGPPMRGRAPAADG